MYTFYIMKITNCPPDIGQSISKSISLNIIDSRDKIVKIVKQILELNNENWFRLQYINYKLEYIKATTLCKR